MKKIPVWIDCDAGVDDAAALLCAHKLPQVELVGISAVAGWAEDAMIWAVQTGLIQGDGVGALNPAASATRMEVAVILMRAANILLGQ